MSSQSTPPTDTASRSHPVHRFAGRVRVAAAALVDTPAWSMSPLELTESLVDLDAAISQLTELKLRVLAAADQAELGTTTASTTTAWAASLTRQVRAHLGADLRLSQQLDEQTFAPTREALAAGRLTVDHSRVITRTLTDLPAAAADPTSPEYVSPELLAAAQTELISLAQEHDAKTLRRIAARIFELLAPEEADRRLGKKLEDEERAARERTRLSMRDNHNGTWSGSFKIPSLQAAMLKKALDAIAAPKRAGADAERIPYARRLGMAFCELIEHLPTDKLPQSGGLAATVLVRLDHQTLLKDLGTAFLDSGDPISAAQARRLACSTGIIPAVFGGGSEPLDIGREQRLFTKSQRVIIADRDQECRAEHCDIPAAWCEAHHRKPWARGGRTDLDNAMLLCPRHHHHAHDGAYDMRTLPSGQVRFTRRT